jgi:predicted dehydrogenase
MKQVRMAIVAATGTARKRLIPAVRAQDLCAIEAIHGRDRHTLAKIAAENSIARYFTDPNQMLDEVRPDFVFIGSPPHLHREHIQMCAERQIPILCEKPLCLSLSEAGQIRSLLKSTGTPFRLAHHLRHQPAVSAIRQRILDNSLGKLVRVAMQWSFWLSETSANAAWKLHPPTGGPHSFYDAGVHAIDLMLHLLSPPTTISAISNKTRFPTIVDNVSAVALCGEVAVELSASLSMKSPLNSLTLDFEEATINVPHAFGERSIVETQTFVAGELVLDRFDDVNLYGNEVEDFISLLNGIRSVGTTIEEACQAMRILEGITEAYTVGRTIVVERMQP